MTSTGEPYPQLTLFAEDTPANPSASPERGKEQTTPGTFGRVSPMPFAYFDQNLLCWKTLQATFLSDLEMSKPIWPRSGITRNGIAYQRQPSAHRTCATEYSSLLHGRMWATPTTQEVEHPNMTITKTGRRATKSNNGQSHSIGLADQVKLWPTPTASAWGATGQRKLLQKQVDAGQITEAEKRQMSAGNGGKLNPEWVEWLMGFPIGWTDLKD